jgi:hypothetical protein
MVAAIDPGDIRKKYTKKMEFLGKVRNGSEHEVGGFMRWIGVGIEEFFIRDILDRRSRSDL